VTWGLALLAQAFGFRVDTLLITTVNYAYYILLVCILASIVINFFPRYPSSGIMQAVYGAVRAIVDPILRPIRSVIPPLRLGGFGLDLSPLIAIIGLNIARRLLIIVIQNFVSPIVA
jgi:YggT family protein